MGITRFKQIGGKTYLIDGKTYLSRIYVYRITSLLFVEHGKYFVTPTAIFNTFINLNGDYGTT